MEFMNTPSQDDDEHLRHLVTLSELHELIIDTAASLGPGFSSLLQGTSIDLEHYMRKLWANYCGVGLPTKQIA